ncbi:MULTISPECIES: DUF6488 family protein [Salipiger]|uniref:DUF6488 family protein n=1 Tax=Salipiger TaxID=263377 RepID=UPI003513C511
MGKQIGLALGLTRLVSQASAHSEGHGTIGPDEAPIAAVNAAGSFSIHEVERDWSPLSQSWAGLPKSAATILAKVDGYFVVSVANDEAERTRELLLAGGGASIDANFTGTFPISGTCRKTAHLPCNDRVHMLKTGAAVASCRRSFVVGAVALLWSIREEDPRRAAKDRGTDSPCGCHG